MVKPVILVGGKSRRFGSDKFFLNINGNYLFERTYNILKSVFNEEPVFIGRWAPALNYQFFPDLIPNLGPIGGLYTAFKLFSSHYVFLIACDMPLIQKEVLEYMYKNLDFSSHIYIPKLENGFIEPLFAFYKSTLLKTIEENISKNDLKLRSLINDHIVQYLTYEEIRSLDPNLYTFLNINTKSDFSKIIDIISSNEKVFDTQI